MLTPSGRNELTRQLRRATALVSTSDGKHGTAFFISRHHLLTCAHVVDSAEQVIIRCDGQDEIVVVEDGDDDLDVAVLRRKPSDLDHGCGVLLHDAPPLLDESLFGFGYPRNALDDQRRGKEISVANTTQWREIDTGATTFIELDNVQIEAGMSGGPLLNLSTGAVVGVVRYANPAGRLGGGAIPIDPVIRRFEAVRRAFDTPDRAVSAWIDVLDPVDLNSLGRIGDGSRPAVTTVSAIATIRLVGDRHAWQVALDAGPAEAALSELEVGEIAAVASSWAQRRSSLTSVELQLLGRMLLRTLLPIGVEQQLTRFIDDQRRPPIIRLDLGSADLHEVPWEYARPAGEQSLATNPDARFVRVVATSNSPEVPRAIGRGEDGRAQRRIKVLTVVSQPEAIRVGLPPRPTKTVWPPAEQVLAELESAIRSGPNRDDLEVLDDGYSVRLNPSGTQFDDLTAANCPVDIVHLVGFGRAEQGEFAFTEEFEPEATSWQSVDSVINCIVGDRPPRILYVQLGPLPRSSADEPLALSAFLPVLERGVLALVGSTRPLHVDLYRYFTQYLYAELAAGASVEEAVQTSRAKLTRPHLDDASLYGAFAVYTAAQWVNIRLVEPRIELGPNRDSPKWSGPR